MVSKDALIAILTCDPVATEIVNIDVPPAPQVSVPATEILPDTALPLNDTRILFEPAPLIIVTPAGTDQLYPDAKWTELTE